MWNHQDGIQKQKKITTEAGQWKPAWDYLRCRTIKQVQVSRIKKDAITIQYYSTIKS